MAAIGGGEFLYRIQGGEGEWQAGQKGKRKEGKCWQQGKKKKVGRGERSERDKKVTREEKIC